MTRLAIIAALALAACGSEPAGGDGTCVEVSCFGFVEISYRCWNEAW